MFDDVEDFIVGAAVGQALSSDSGSSSKRSFSDLTPLEKALRTGRFQKVADRANTPEESALIVKVNQNLSEQSTGSKISALGVLGALASAAATVYLGLDYGAVGPTGIARIVASGELPWLAATAVGIAAAVGGFVQDINATTKLHENAQALVDSIDARLGIDSLALSRRLKIRPASGLDSPLAKSDDANKPSVEATLAQASPASSGVGHQPNYGTLKTTTVIDRVEAPTKVQQATPVNGRVAQTSIVKPIGKRTNFTP